MLKHIFKFAGLFLLLCVVHPQILRAELFVKEVKLGEHPDKTRFVFKISDEVSYKVFTLDKPYRVVIDLPNLAWQAGQLEKPKGLVTGFRFGLYSEDVSRIVLDVKDPVTVEKVFYLPPEEGVDGLKRLVLDIKKTDAKTFANELSLTHKFAGKKGFLVTEAVVKPAEEPSVKMPVVASKPSTPKAKRLIVIDPGHGGVDPGTISKSGIYEKDITLAAAKELKKHLLASGQFDVVLTREKDIFVRLRDRTALAKKLNADLFISLHADSAPRKTAKGASIYTLSEKGSDKEAEYLAARENKADIIAGVDLSAADDEVAGILIELAQRDTMNMSKQFAMMLVHHFGPQVLIPSRPHRSAGFAVLKAPDIPSVLIEMGYLSNPQDANLLRSPHYQEKLSKSIVTAVDGFFKLDHSLHFTTNMQ